MHEPIDDADAAPSAAPRRRRRSRSDSAAESIARGEPTGGGDLAEGGDATGFDPVAAAEPTPDVDLDAASTALLALAGDRAEAFAARHGLRFRDLALLRLALAHRSILTELFPERRSGTPSPLLTNERLEFFGDAVLGYVAAAYLYAAEPEADEGALTRQRVALVRAETLVRWARELDLGDYLIVGGKERPSEGARDRMLAGAFEALVGAIAIDQGMVAARRFLLPFVRREAAALVAEAAATTNPKGKLQEILQARYRLGPTYVLTAAEGPQHARSFAVEVRLGERLLGSGVGGTKRDAEQQAADAALAALGAAHGERAGAKAAKGKRRSKR